MESCEEFARRRLEDRQIKPSTLKEYLGTLKQLGLSDIPHQDITISLVNSRLQTIINPGTRRKHAINVRAVLGIHIRCPKLPQKVYALPPIQDIHAALEGTTHEMWGFIMLYGGLRVGEACARQPLAGRVLTVDRQRLAGGQIASAKTTGPVIIPQWLADKYLDHEWDRATNTIYIGIRRTFKRAGIRLTPHGLRHAFATNLVKAGASPEILRRQMRHHDVAISLRYYVHTSDSDIMAVMDSFGSPNG